MTNEETISHLSLVLGDMEKEYNMAAVKNIALQQELAKLPDLFQMKETMFAIERAIKWVQSDKIKICS